MSAKDHETVSSLISISGISGVVHAKQEMARYLEDWWGRNVGDATCVVLPRTAAEVSSIVSLCRERGIAIYPQGGNTSVCGGAVPPVGSQGIVVNLARMNTVLDVNPRDNSITVQAGCLLANVQAAARAADRLFPLSLGAEGSCQIGGNIATNAGGTGVVRYGNTRDLVLGLEVVLPDGRIWNGLRTLRKNNSGYDLKNVFIGAEGTLGIVTAAALKLFPLLPNTVTALIAVSRIEDAVELGLDLGREFQAEITALELISARQLQFVVKHVPNTAHPLAAASDWCLLLELASSVSSESLSQRLGDCVEPYLEDGIVQDTVIAVSEAQRQSLWRLRHSVTEANKREGMGLSYDIAVPIFAVATFLRRADELIGHAYPEARIAVVGHLGDGNIHYIVMFDRAVWDALPDKNACQRDVSRLVYDLAHELRGTFSAEHGIGSLHLDEMERYKDPVELDLMVEFKQLLDPQCFMNPDRVLSRAVSARYATHLTTQSGRSGKC